MDLKWILLVAFVLVLVVNHQVEADFRSWPDADELEMKGLKCAPGRTIIKLEEKKAEPIIIDSGDEEDNYNGRRTHMNTNIKEEYCKVCVCSAEGKDEYCSGRPAANVNECIRMSKIMEEFNRNEPYEHTRVLSQRIRRDYIWHNDEIPYEPKAKCRRGHSYYSNSLNANDTDIDVASDVNSLLDYSNTSICFYCVCTPDGRGVGCINRKAWFCEYYRHLRNADYARDLYRNMFQQDRPSYFRQLSWRLRRTMDDGLYDFTDAVGGNDDEKEVSTCVPFVSEYTTCNAENQCRGCIRCLCILGGRWSCQEVRKCRDDGPEEIAYNAINTAMNEIQFSIENYNRNEATTSKTPFVPPPPEREPDLLLDNYAKDMDLDTRIASLLRNKRSTGKTNSTKGVKFYHTVDEINEDTLKSGNVSGTLQAKKVGVVKTPKISRRTGLLTSGNDSQTPLHIAYNEPKAYDPHLADNKIDAVHHDEQSDTLSRIQAVIGNHTQKQKDKDLSKLVVNELKPGEEIIGDKKAKIMSNITFTPENDTLTAMAFIAGNLLNKLWNMEKDSGEDSIEAEVLKHEKIADLLDLFKEPLNLRQENFLKNALETLSEAIDKNKNLNNISLCEKMEETKKLLRAENSSSEETKTEKSVLDKLVKTEPSQETNLESVTEAITKINNVLSLMNKFQKVHKNLNDLKRKSLESTENVKRKTYEVHEIPHKVDLSEDESTSLNVFGNVLEKLTKLLLPPKKSKKMVKNIRNLNVLRNPKDVAKKIKSQYNIDVDSSNLSPKDQLVFDYLSTVKNNPKCIFNSLRDNDQSSIAKIEGDILLNLSEFFKVKSFVDLMKMLDSETETKVRSRDETTIITPEVTTATSTTTVTTTTKVSNKLKETKEKLKEHLKSIIDDLIELQNAKGHPTNNISIADALPCIYNILNADKSTQGQFLDIKTTTMSPVNKVAEIFDSLRQELVSTPTRRSSTPTGRKPKGAAVWERIFKNFDDLNKVHSRRNMNTKEPKTFEELKKLMDESESSSKTYKNLALINGVPPSERLILLKTLSEEAKQYINVLEEIENSMSNFKSFSPDEKTDLRDFIDNAATNINLDNNIAKIINNLKEKKYSLVENGPKVGKKPKESYAQMQSIKRLDVNPLSERKNVKLTRDSIINQLIKNRMQLYTKLKESENVDLENDLNYSIAKKVLTYLDIGNYALARELYKVIVSQKKKTIQPTDQQSVKSISRNSMFGKTPIVQFEEPRGQSQLQWLNQDIWLKQLSNLKNMKA